MALHSKLARLWQNRRGVTIVEFAFVAPVLCILLMGAFDVAHTLFVRAALDGIVQKAARDSTLEDATSTAQQAAIDAKVRSEVQRIVHGAQVDPSRRFYRTFTAAANATPETWTDTNHNGVCDGSEPYEDANNNGVWDADGGNAGQGGAKDATLYTVKVSYPRVFPAAGFLGISNTVNLSVSTVLRNQPYSDQGSYATATIKNCPAAIVASPTPTASSTPTPAPSATSTSGGSGGSSGGGSSGGGCQLMLLGACIL